MDDNGRSASRPEWQAVLLDRLRRFERRATSSQVASVIGHLIGTPLNVIAGRAALIRRSPTPESAEENARRIEEQVERLALRVRGLIEYLTETDPEAEPQPAEQVLADALTLAGPIAQHCGVLLSAPLLERAQRIERLGTLTVLTSLLSMAANLTPRGGSIPFSVQTQEGGVLFEVGVPGMAPPRARIDKLEPPDEGERGIAERLQLLSVCSAIARRAGGRLEVTAATPRGSNLRFFCPSST